jgi:hypothetical protein
LLEATDFSCIVSFLKKWLSISLSRSAPATVRFWLSKKLLFLIGCVLCRTFWMILVGSIIFNISVIYCLTLSGLSLILYKVILWTLSLTKNSSPPENQKKNS